MGNIKKLAGQTIWYGVPTIVHRFLGFILQLFVTGLIRTDEFGIITQVYALIPFLNILFTYGLETSYFRFIQTEDKAKLYNTLSVSMLVSTIALTAVLLLANQPLASVMSISDHRPLVLLMAGIIFFDTLSTLPFARIRQEGRPRKYAAVKLLAILTQIALTLFFLVAGPKLAAQGMADWYNPAHRVAYFMLANLLASAFALVFLYKEIVSFRWEFNKSLWKEVMLYGLPLIIVGLGGMTNETLSRFIFPMVYPYPEEQTRVQLGIFGAGYKLAVLVTIFINAFRMAAEPFFFNHSKNEGAQATYARIMKFFVMALGAVFLVVSLFLDLWGIFISLGPDKRYVEGLQIVPIIAMATVFLGVYYNLTIWYKLTNRNLMAAYVTIAGAVITVALNIWWIPLYGYVGSAWATFICYGFMMTVSYLLGQKYYPVPYNVARIVTYLGLAALIYAGHHYLRTLQPGVMLLHACGILGLGIYMAVIGFMERAEIRGLFSRKAG